MVLHILPVGVQEVVVEAHVLFQFAVFQHVVGGDADTGVEVVEVVFERIGVVFSFRIDLEAIEAGSLVVVVNVAVEGLVFEEMFEIEVDAGVGGGVVGILFHVLADGLGP